MNANVTKENIKVKAGQVWKDLDKRQNGKRYVKVLEVRDGKAVAVLCSKSGIVITFRQTRISIARMHKHASGYELVQQ